VKAGFAHLFHIFFLGLLRGKLAMKRKLSHEASLKHFLKESCLFARMF
jgi:hypothetical protein